MAEKRTYVVWWITRGIQTMTVEATTAKEAERIAKFVGSKTGVHEITSSGRPHARLDRESSR